MHKALDGSDLLQADGCSQLLFDVAPLSAKRAIAVAALVRLRSST